MLRTVSNVSFTVAYAKGPDVYRGNGTFTIEFQDFGAGKKLTIEKQPGCQGLMVLNKKEADEWSTFEERLTLIMCKKNFDVCKQNYNNVGFNQSPSVTSGKSLLSSGNPPTTSNISKNWKRSATALWITCATAPMRWPASTRVNSMQPCRKCSTFSNTRQCRRSDEKVGGHEEMDTGKKRRAYSNKPPYASPKILNQINRNG